MKIVRIKGLLVLCSVFYITTLKMVTQDGQFSPRRNKCASFQKIVRDNGFSVSDCNGRLGNQLGVLALGLQLYLKHGIKLVLQDFQNKELMTAFDSSMCDEDYNNAFCILLPPGCNLPEPAYRVSASQDLLRKRGVEAYSFDVDNSIPAGVRVDLPIYPMFLEWFGDTELLAQFRKKVVFKDEVLQASKGIYRSILSNNSCDALFYNCTMVSIHLRMGDYDTHLQTLGWGPVFTSTDYIQRVMKYVTKTYPNPVFILFAEDVMSAMKYFHSVFGKSSKVISTGGFNITTDLNLQRSIDLALMSMVDVSIMTYGSFGDFGVLLTRDKVAYFPKNHPAHKETGVNLGIPGFIGLEWTNLPNNTI